MKFRLILRRAANIAAAALTVITLATAAFILLSRTGDETPFMFGKTVLWVTTDSMSPTIAENCYILAGKVDPGEVAVDDIIVFISHDAKIDGMRNTHRVIAIQGDREGFVTKGDNTEGPDDYIVKPEDIVARYETTLGFISGLGRLFSSAIGLSAFCVIFIVALSLLFLPEINSARNRSGRSIASVAVEGALPPAAGELPSSVCKVADPSECRVESVSWLYSGESGGGALGEGEPFCADGTHYSLCVTAAPEDGYSFCEACEATVNGEKAASKLCGDKLIVMFDFGKAK